MNNQPWLNSYPISVPHTIDSDQYSSLTHLFKDCVDRFGDLPALVNMGKELSFNELDELSDNFAAYIKNYTQLSEGDRVIVQLPNILQFPIAVIGALKCGLVPVNTNPVYTAHEMEHQYNDSGAKGVIILANYANKLESIVEKTSIETVIITEVGDLLGQIKGSLVNLGVRFLKQMVPDYDLPQAIPFKKVIHDGKRHRIEYANVNIDAIALLQYTGGTTGLAKGAALSHRNLIANVLQANAWMKPILREKEEIVITALPLYHVFAFTVNLFTMMRYGAKNVLITDPRNLKDFIHEIKKYPFSILTGVNTLFNALLNRKEFLSVDFSSLKVTVGGAMAIQSSVANRWFEITGNALVEGYGLSEASPLLTCNPIDGSHKLGTIGLPVPNTEIIIADDDGNPLSLGERGEILAKGPQIMTGYWNNEAETKNVMFNGYLKTGDVGIMDESGFIKIVDRKKDMINVSGFKVFPNEVEDILSKHDKVLEVGVIGIPDDKLNEEVTAFIIKKDPTVTEHELKTFCNENLTAYKRPKTFIFVEDLPKSAIGKVLRKDLRKQVASQ